MADLIERQAAIDSMGNMYKAAEKWMQEAKDDITGARAESCMASLVEMKLRIEKLPSAQPEKEALDDAYAHGYTAAESEFRKRMDAQPEPQWTPCSERMPEDLEEVNVTWVNHDPEPYYDFTKDKPATASAVYYKGKWYWYSSVCTDLLAEYGENEVDKMDDAIEVIAWMPLPESYKGE